MDNTNETDNTLPATEVIDTPAKGESTEGEAAPESITEGAQVGEQKAD